MKRENLLRDLRLNKNYRIIDVAEILNVSASYYGDIERGTRKQNRKIFLKWLKVLQGLPKLAPLKRKDKFQLRAARYNKNHPIEHIEPEFFKALYLALKKPLVVFKGQTTNRGINMDYKPFGSNWRKRIKRMEKDDIIDLLQTQCEHRAGIDLTPQDVKEQERFDDLILEPKPVRGVIGCIVLICFLLAFMALGVALVISLIGGNS